MNADVYYPFLVVAGFASGFIDSIAGGGGMISLPAFLLTGMDPRMAVATNKLAASFGSLTSSARYLRARQVAPIGWWLAALGFAGSLPGAWLAQSMKSTQFKLLVTMALIGVGCFVAFRKDYGKIKRARHTGPVEYLAACLLTVAIGFYDGLVGPGTGTFLTFAFIGVLGLDFLQATGTTKIVNAATNVAALGMFLLCRTPIQWSAGIVMGVAILAGAFTGSGLAVRIGPRFIKPLFVGVAVLLAVKLAWESMRFGK